MNDIRRGTAFVVALAGTCSMSLLTGLLAAGLQGWFGVLDLWALSVWSVPLSCLTGAVAAAISPVAARWRVPMRLVLSLGVGTVLGFLWTLIVTMLWGPWSGAMRLPAFASWMAGGVSGIAAGVVLAATLPVRVKVTTPGLEATFAVALLLVNQPFLTWLSGDQTLTVVFLTLEPRNEPLSIESEHPEPPGLDVLSLLRLANVRGHVTVKWGGSVNRRGPSAKVLILLRGPVTSPVHLHQPDRTTVLYVQDADGFKAYPHGAATVQRNIDLSGRAAGVWYSVELAYGARESGPAFSW